MNIAIASGKGGTGKTTVATNLAWVASRSGRSAAYVDCDVEAPNGHIFLKPQIESRRPFSVPVPKVDTDRCVNCGRCGDICQFSAIVCVGDTVLLFSELCHGCGGCSRVCPSGAISEVPRQTGLIESANGGQVPFVRGLLNVGEAMSPPLIRAVKAAAPQVDLLIVDAPPGTSCPVIESVRGSDYLVLVTEPTPFGLHDLTLAIEMARALEIPCGVVVNRAGAGDDRAQRHCVEHGVPVLAEIPDDMQIARAYSRGEMACEAVPETRRAFSALLDEILARAAEAAPAKQ